MGGQGNPLPCKPERGLRRMITFKQAACRLFVADSKGFAVREKRRFMQVLEFIFGYVDFFFANLLCKPLFDRSLRLKFRLRTLFCALTFQV